MLGLGRTDRLRRVTALVAAGMTAATVVAACSSSAACAAISASQQPTRHPDRLAPRPCCHFSAAKTQRPNRTRHVCPAEALPLPPRNCVKAWVAIEGVS